MTTTDILDEEITGAPVKVSIAGTEYGLTYPMFAVTLYKQETAKLDRKRGAGRPKLTPAELRELKDRRRTILSNADESDPAAWSVAVEEALEIKRRIDEESCAGDSLFNVESWYKISQDDPERILLALWSGLHVQQADESWKAPLSLGQLERLVDFSNCRELLTQIHEALARYMPKRKQEEARPNAPWPETAEALPAGMTK